MQHPQSSQGKTDPAQQDTEALFLDMLTSHEDALFRFIYFRIGNRALAVDLTQDVFTKTWLYLSQGKSIEYPEAFLYRAAKNALIDYYKKAKSGSLDTLLDGGFDPGSTDSVDEILRQDSIEEIRTLLETLDEDSKQIIFLRYTEEKPIEEIASLYGKSVNAMTVHIHRIIKKLRDTYSHGT